MRRLIAAAAFALLTASCSSPTHQAMPVEQKDTGHVDTGGGGGGGM